MNLQNEISRTPPHDMAERIFKDGTPILYAFDCALLERETYSGYVYTAVNLKTNKSIIISRRTNPLTPSGIDAIVEKIRLSRIAGAGRFEVDRAFEEKIDIADARDILNEIFQTILPQHGYAIRAEQISLAEHILESLRLHSISLSEAEVGTGKTLAYLIAAVIVKRGRLNDFWNMGAYPNMQYSEMAQMPIVIATSSIALQRALITTYIPDLSNILLKNGIIKKPLTTALRKGREHYICERNLRSYTLYEHNQTVKKILGDLKLPSSIDLSETDGLTPYIKRKICVPKKCYDDCPYRKNCEYLQFRSKSQSSDIDIQVCNHNYFLADTLLKKNEQRSLIPNYQTLIIDEAHKFLSAARTMYGAELSILSLPDISKTIDTLNFKNESAQKTVQQAMKILLDKNKRLFGGLSLKYQNADLNNNSKKLTVRLDNDDIRHLRKICEMTEILLNLMESESLVGYGAEKKSQIIWDLKQIRKQASAFIEHGEVISWLESENQEKRLCAVPKELDKILYEDLWSKGIPTILTSGTLSAVGDFSRIKQTLGLDYAKQRLREISKPSPFDYQKNALLYISENMPFPNQRNPKYILAVADEVEKLIYASHGHAAVLFTSYKAMDMVWEHIKKRDMPFPMFRLDKGGVREIERFKESGNGVLFASGAMWEGIDIPGDALSMLIIIKLPFAAPDPIGEYEQTLYKDKYEYKELVIIPDMLIKLKQGDGRPIRTETDTAVTAIIDCRVAEKAKYRKCVLDTLRKRRVTKYICNVEQFYRDVKNPEYFK